MQDKRGVLTSGPHLIKKNGSNIHDMVYNETGVFSLRQEGESGHTELWACVKLLCIVARAYALSENLA